MIGHDNVIRSIDQSSPGLFRLAEANLVIKKLASNVLIQTSNQVEASVNLIPNIGLLFAEKVPENNTRRLCDFKIKSADTK